MLFTGHAELTIDAKSRLAIPSKFRGLLDASRDGSAWFCVPWPGGMLRLYTEARFVALAESTEQSLTPGQDEASLQSDLFGLTERIEMDSAGRITLPRAQMELTGLSPQTDVVVVGAGNRLEVHAKAAWLDGMKQRFSQLPALVARTEMKKTRG